MLRIFIGVSLVLGSLNSYCQTRLIPHITRSGGGFETELVVENLALGQTQLTLTPFDDRGQNLGPMSTTLDSLETRRMASTDWFPDLNVSHVMIEGQDTRVTAAYRSLGEGPSPAHVGETRVNGFRYRLFAGNWNVVFDGVAVVNLGEDAAQVRVRQTTFSGLETQVELLAADLAPMGKALYVLGGPAGSAFENREDSFFEIYADQPLALTALRGNQPGAQFLWTNPTEIQNLAMTKVSQDAPENDACRSPADIGNGMGDLNNMPQVNGWMAVAEDGRLAIGAADYRFSATDSSAFGESSWGGLYTSSDQGGAWRNSVFNDSNPHEGLTLTTTGDYQLAPGKTVTFRQQKDQIVEFDRDGNLYTCSRLYNLTTIIKFPRIQDPSGLMVTRTGGVDESPTVTQTLGLEDDPSLVNLNPTMAVDRTAVVGETVVAVAWNLSSISEGPVPRGLYLAVSADGAATFSAPFRIPVPENGTGTDPRLVIGLDKENGQKTLFLFQTDTDPFNFDFQMHLYKVSLDGVAAGDTAALAAQIENPQNWSFKLNGIPGQKLSSASHLAGNLIHNVMFAPALDQQTGDLFVVASVLDAPTNGTKMVVSKSENGGLSWSPPRAIDYPRSVNQILPTVAVRNGQLSVIWYDTRHGGGLGPDRRFSHLDVYYAELNRDLAVTRVLRVTRASQFVDIPSFTNENGVPAKRDVLKLEGETGLRQETLVDKRICIPYGFLGDQLGIAADDQFAYLTWTDYRDLAPYEADLCVDSPCDGRRNTNIYFARVRKGSRL